MNRTSPITGWLRALAGGLHTECGGPGVGAIGMCFSGGFALGMMLDETTVAPVLSQPSLPVATPIGRKRGANLNLSPADLATVKGRAAAGCEVLGLGLGLRYTGDRLVGDRFDALRDELGDAFIAIELSSTKKTDHSVVTEQRDEATVHCVLDFFRAKLLT